MTDTSPDSSRDSNFALIRDGVASYLNDSDPEETREWLESWTGCWRTQIVIVRATSCCA